MRPLTRREHELVVVALDRYADVERSAGNTITASLFTEIRIDIESKPLRGELRSDRGVA